MKHAWIAWAASTMIACEAPPAPGPASSAPAASTAPAATAAATPAATATPTPKGLEPGKVVIGYMQDLKDDGQCGAIVAPKGEEPDEKGRKDTAEVLHAKWVDACPSDNVVLVCNVGFALVNYYGPKYTAETAKARCGKEGGAPVE